MSDRCLGFAAVAIVALCVYLFTTGAVLVGMSKRDGCVPYSDYYVPGVVLMSVTASIALILGVGGLCLLFFILAASGRR